LFFIVGRRREIEVLLRLQVDRTIGRSLDQDRNEALVLA